MTPALPRPTEGDVVDLILTDHRLFEDLLRALRDVTSDRRDVVATLSELLVAHGEAEESKVYPLLRMKQAIDAHEVEHGEQEHAEGYQALLPLLEAADVDSEEFSSGIHEFSETLLHHLDEEERDILNPARTSVTDDDRTRLGADWAAERNRLLDAGCGSPDQVRRLVRDAEERSGESPVTSDLIDDLTWRGLIAHSTDLGALRAEMDEGPISAYCGFDPTAPSLHHGNLLQIFTLRRLQDAGHRPFGLVGGATGMIGDPKEAGERKLNSLDVVKTWTEAVRDQLGRFLSFEGGNAARVVNNYDWTASLSTIDFLRDIGKHFPVNRMLARDVVRSRLDSGISYTEFSYVLLQSMDYLNLFREHGVRLQTGGSDQWGNITGGVDLVRRVSGAKVHALATPLVTKADGSKFGKTESGTLWLDESMTSPYAFHQFWLNADDQDVVALLKYFTFRTRAEIEELARQVSDKPSLRAAQRTLADDLTTLTHGPDHTARVKAAADALFGGGELRDLDERTLAAALGEAPHIEVSPGSLPTYAELLADTGLVASRSAARRTVVEGGAYLNNQRIADADSSPTSADILPGGWLVLRRGKRSLAGVRCGQ